MKRRTIADCRRLRANTAAARLVCGVMMLFAAAGSAFADDVRTSTNRGFARLLFTLDPPARATANLTGGVLAISFDRKIDIPASSLASGLSSYISGVRADADGKTFRLALVEEVRLHTSTVTDHVAIDLVPQDFAGTPPDLPPPPPGKRPPPVDVAKLPALMLRAGAYGTFTRLIFDWPRVVPYTVFPGAGRTTIRFEAHARPDFAALDQVSPPWVKEAGWRIEGGGTVIDFDTDPASSSRAFRKGTSVALDILAPKTDARPRDAAAGSTDKKVNVLKLPAGPDTATHAQAKAIAATAAALQDAAATAATLSQAAPAQISATTQAAPAPSRIPPPPASLASAAAVQARRTKDGAVIRIPAGAETPVAAFVRGTTAFVVLDGRVAIDSAGLKNWLGEFPSFLEASNSGEMIVLRIGLRQREHIAAMADGPDLRIVLSPNADQAARDIALVHAADASGRPVIEATVPGAAHVLAISDPDVGDELKVVPGQVGDALPARHDFADFSVLPSAAGLVVLPHRDDLLVDMAKEDVRISRTGGLTLTAVTKPPAPDYLSRAGQTFLDFATWDGKGRDGLLEAERRLRAEAAMQIPGNANAARLALARLYLANGCAAEALGLLHLVAASDPARQGDSLLARMRAAADVMLGRYGDARNELANRDFDDDPDAAFWRGLAEAGSMNWEGAQKAFVQAEPIVARYPALWQARARIAMARASLAVGAIGDARKALARLPQDLPWPLALEAQLARAGLDSADGRPTQAAASFRAVENGGNDALAAQAIFAEVESDIAHRKLSNDAAVAKLEQLRYRWRGDALELRVLRKLGALYFARGRWRDGLQVLRVAAEGFPQEDLAHSAQDDMRAAFVSLFLKGKADTLPPVAALGLFYDFIDLTPIGADGDEMIRRMAGRLVAVDLLEPAASLLTYQATNRLDGVARAEVATRAAMIDLMDHRPKEALEVLHMSDISGLPDDLTHARKILEARSLGALRQWDRALDLVAVDDAPDTRHLRADIYWESGDWETAGRKTEELIGSRGGMAPLSTDDRREIMRAAIAYSLANDQSGLDRLRARYASEMTASPDAKAFAVVSQPIDMQGTAFRNLAARIASIDTLEAFMQDFRKRFDAMPATN